MWSHGTLILEMTVMDREVSVLKEDFRYFHFMKMECNVMQAHMEKHWFAWERRESPAQSLYWALCEKGRERSRNSLGMACADDDGEL